MDEQVETRARTDRDVTGEPFPVAQHRVEDVVLVQLLEELADRPVGDRLHAEATLRGRGQT